MSSAPVDPMIGRILDDRYVVRSRIARGGMATVYVANDTRLERRVAIKIMHGHLADDNAFKKRFVQEARSAARLSHPNVVNVYDQGQDSEMAYLVMEYLPGITLRDLLRAQKRLTADQAYEISEAVLAGLSAAHLAGIMHRDLKPENVLLADDGRIKIGDFGLARAASANTTTGQALLGTIAYLSPELVTRGIADARSDVYAFGIMLFEMLTGQQPFTGEQPMQIAYQHAHDDVPAPSTLTPEATPELDELVRWTTIRDPDARPRDATIVLERLRQLRAVPGHPAGLNPTRVLTGHVSLTPSTSVLDQTQVQGLRNGPHTTGEQPPGGEAEAPAETPLSRVHAAGQRRTVVGRVTAALVTAAAVALAVGGWWIGQGPGALVSVPEVVNLKIDAAQAMLGEHDLIPLVTECPSVTVPVGHTVSASPEVGTRVERESEITLCSSTGPRILPVPELLGITLDEAKQRIADADFRFGAVTEERFSDQPKGAVLQTLTADLEDLGPEYAEQGEINLIVSAGPLPEVIGASLAEATRALEEAGLTIDTAKQADFFSAEQPADHVIRPVYGSDTVSVGDAVSLEVSAGTIPEVSGDSVADATKKLEGVGLTVNAELRTEVFHPDVAKDRAIRALPQTDPVRVGDPVGIEVSQGPELFPVPDVSGMTVREAVNTLTDAGFTPKVDAIVLEALWNAVKVNNTDPRAGSKIPAGAEVKVGFPR
ncbi:Stk1 family PASTA domain-containing Ser/Thr kinase [Leucobacter sp. M11]|uniref:Stk1 family PASTA domain-containing Ser/Thr kinase n=1 Tax=Leucobacter sp. M11 TaxID=2993565 RepID=UPI002D7E2A55|nr:Stk1 family PASTA domain-containing Ser/Thr kinase [Leucobacter sp. M11]MEB4616563.1 Stk1 family PASTA domain-containing Ser/Thr kinase [Leucobacter sp. M11]